MAAFGGESSTSTGLEKLISRMEKDGLDLNAVGRALISDPQWATKVRTANTVDLKGFSPAALAELV